MIPDDESVRRAMQSIEPAGADVPGLFDRVAAGARRRRRQRSIGAVVAAAVVVAAVALVPALGRHNSSTNTQPAGPGPVASSLPSGSSLLNGNEHPSSPVSPLALASSPMAVGSPLSSTPPTTPSLPIATGTCAPGISADFRVGSARPVLVTPGANPLHLSVGDQVTFTTDGACAAHYFYWPTGEDVFGALLPGSALNPSSFGNTLTATATGTEELSFRRQACDDGGPSCESPTGPALASVTVTVSPATVRFADATTEASTPLPTATTGCPTETANGLAGDVNGTATQEAAVFDAVAGAAQTLYGSSSSNGTVQITAIYRAVDRTGFGIVADSICGKTLGDDSYVVELHIPNAVNSASIGSGQVFVAQFATGWRVWFRYR
ncbi:MAG TPA: hypothetical protein VN683_03775 [Acidothermaceae bacterium]|nr:hypothetical protein [Acidothermaceae bacterium]